MKPTIFISERVEKLLRCPVCRAKLKKNHSVFECTSSECNIYFPVVDGIPVLINENTSIFSIKDIVSKREIIKERDDTLKRTIRQLIPTISKNLKGKANLVRFSQELLTRNSSPLILVIGTGVFGEGMDVLLNNSAIEVVETDVTFGPRAKLICDAHDIPFDDNSFDGVIIQAVLEHVVDPYKCCEEIHRVLKIDGLVYAETPFMQQVHYGPYDFTRFTYLGHRRLFRKFEEIDSGIICGPGMAFAWAYQYFLLSFTSSKWLRRILNIFAHFTSFYLKYFDYYLIKKQPAFDAASGYYFLGQKSKNIISDKDLLKLYKGNG